MSSIPNRIPELDVNKDKDLKTLYGLYSVCVYDDGHQDNQFCIALDDTLNDDKLSNKIHAIFDKHTVHCEVNKTFTLYTLIIRKVKFTIESDAIETRTKHFTPKFELHNPTCENCGGIIKYGDEVYIYNEKKFCSPECITEHLKVTEVIEKCSSENIWSLWEFEEIFPDLKRVTSDINVDRHRWYELATNVYECEDGFVGVEGISEVFSEMMSNSDCDCPCTAAEYEAVQTITYKHKAANG